LTGKELVIRDATPDCTIAELAALIHRETNCPVNVMRLIANGKRVYGHPSAEHHVTLAAAGLHNGCIVSVVLRSD
jgi:hypothetical protein